MTTLSRQDFLRRTLKGAGAIWALGLGAQACRAFLPKISRDDFDVIIRNGELVDGSGAESYQADIGIKDGLIVAIANLDSSRARRNLDARHMVVSPGFIDIHSHSDYTLLRWPEAWSKIYQGVTTEVTGQDGRSVAPHKNTSANWRDLGDYHHQIQSQGISVNLRTMIGAGSLRQTVIGSHNQKARFKDIQSMLELIQETQIHGAWGLSSGLEYLPGAYASVGELYRLARPCHLYSTHMRNEDDFVISAIDEAILIARKAGCALNISHIKAQGKGNWDRLPKMLQRLDQARTELPFVSCDRYPYLAYNTRLINLFPVELRPKPIDLVLFLRSTNNRRIIKSQVMQKIDSLGGFHGILLNAIPSSYYRKFSGKRVDTIARQLGQDPWQVLCDIIVDSSGQGPMVGFGMQEANLHRLLRYPYCAIASDGASLMAGNAPGAHPRNFGTFPHVLGHYVADKEIISLEEAIRKMTSLPARIMKIRRRGLIKQGYYADLVVFDPDQIRSRSSYTRPDRYPTGIAHVLVNGSSVLYDGDHTRQKPGMLV